MNPKVEDKKLGFRLQWLQTLTNPSYEICKKIVGMEDPMDFTDRDVPFSVLPLDFGRYRRQRLTPAD